MSASLAEALRQGTRALHTEVERSPFMRTLLRGQMPRGAYCLLLRNLHALYACLEGVLAAARAHPMLARLHDPQLARTAALAQDLDVLHGPGWDRGLAVLPACTTYQERLRTLAREAPQLLVAHAYVRYLGDLSGGQQLRRIVARSLGLPAGGAGVAFYDFGDETQAGRLSAGLREQLAGMPADARDIAQIVAEAQDAFLRHGQLFAELADATAQAPAPSTRLRDA